MYFCRNLDQLINQGKENENQTRRIKNLKKRTQNQRNIGTREKEKSIELMQNHNSKR